VKTAKQRSSAVHTARHTSRARTHMYYLSSCDMR
jgi:hypothetical protein